MTRCHMSRYIIPSMQETCLSLPVCVVTVVPDSLMPPPQDGKSALMVHCERGGKEITEELCRQGAPIDTQDKVRLSL